MSGDGPTWTDIVGAIGGIIGTGGGMVGIVIAGLAKRHARESAEEAAKLTAIEQERRAEERERRHEDLAPQLPGEIVMELRDGRATQSLFGAITVTRSYRVQAEALFRSGGKSLLGMPAVLRPHQRVEFEVEKWPAGATQPKTEAVKFRFWPPIEGDDVDTWACPCSKPTGESLDGPGHWECTVPVTYHDVLQSVW